MLSFSHKSPVPDDCMSKRIPVSRDVAAVTINPHRLAALTWAVVGHAGGAPGWGYYLFFGSFVGCRWCRECRHEQ
jgi:hypothetical protein